MKSVVAIAITVLCGLSVSCQQGSRSRGKASAQENGEAKAEPCEGYQCLSLDMTDLDGAVYTPSLLKGKVVVVNFWATWCKPCLKEIPDFAKVYTAYKDKGVVMLGVLNEDSWNQETVEGFAKRTGLNYPIIPIDQKILEDFGYPDRLPSTYIYGTDGKLAMERIGVLNEHDLTTTIDKLLTASVAK